MTRFILPIIIFFATFLTSCIDDFDYYGDVGEGMADLEATVSFHPLIASNVNDKDSRTEGNAIRNIRNIQLVIYNADNSLLDIKRYGFQGASEFTIAEEPNKGMPSDIKPTDDKGRPVQSEAETQTATFTIPMMPFGHYRFYVVANYPQLDEDAISTPGELKSLTAKWNQELISANDQMFGCLAPGNNSEYDGGDAPLLTITKNVSKLSGWIKRLASKVTIVYDGQGLKDGINIYIKSVSIRDIPRTCVLGFDTSQLTEEEKNHNVNGNCPNELTELIAEPKNGTLYYRTVFQSNDPNMVDSVVTTATEPANNADYLKWMHIDSSVRALGAVSTGADHKYDRDQNGEIVAHTENMQALFFYENCQGDYKGLGEEFNKKPEVGDVYKPENDPDVYKDRVPFGTFIEVEGYYVSRNPNNVSEGPIKYRFMLGQNETFDYNALRNRHYKLTLKFKGYANQPEWHIVYNEEEPGLYPFPSYDVSYMYNVRHNMPIRLTGHPYKVTLQIIENNWAPYDSTQTDSVAPAGPIGSGNTAFRWYRDLYAQNNVTGTGTGAINTQNYSPKPTSSFDGLSGYYYGLHPATDYNSLVPYSPAVDWLKDEQMTPIWAGFLALQVAEAYEDYSVILPTGIQDDQAAGDKYDKETTVQGMREYYTGKGGLDSGSGNGASKNTNTTVKMYECTYEFADIMPTQPGQTVNVASDQGNKSSTGRNAATLTRNGDDSYTLTAPLFTMPKSMGYISGFSGNNPYEAYQRRAKVLITAYYNVGNRDSVIKRRVPIFQQQRIVNPKGVWRTGTNQDAFNVQLMKLDKPDAEYYTPLESNGEWSAWVATPEHEETPDTKSFVTLDGNNSFIKGVSFVNFTININGTTTGSRCAKVIVKYNGNSCEHAIFVRQGYNVPLAVVDGGAQWSSFSVYAFQGDNLTNAVANLPRENLDLNAEMTVNPLALGTMYKRGNYGQGIRIINNKTWKVMERVTGPMKLVRLNSSGQRDTLDANDGWKSTATWSSMKGIRADNDDLRNWRWSTFHGSIVTSTNDYLYDVPSFEDYNALVGQDFGVGVVYADGGTETLRKAEDAYGYFNDGNNDAMTSNPKGMRGIIVYNRVNFNQIFFPLGYSGVGRRTVQLVESTADQGYLRYGSTYWRLSTGTAPANQYRPVSYNLPANPGAMYWIKKTYDINTTDDRYISAWDINYFDLAFNGYAAVTNDPNGDAIPIKPKIRGTGVTPSN